jgi:hypothetical protein
MTGPYHVDVNIVFERPALERFVQLAREALSYPPTLVSAAHTT